MEKHKKTKDNNKFGENRLIENSETQKRISDRLVDLVDIVFGVVVGTSIAAIFTNNSLEAWPSLQEIVTLSNMSLLVAYIAVILSWVGYHRMIELNPYKLNRWGYIRFGIDAVIVFMYTVLIYARENFSIFLLAFPIIFLLYACGGIVRIKEYGKVSWPRGSFMYMLLFLVNWIIWSNWDSLVSIASFIKLIPISWILLLLTLFYLFYYRRQREKRGFSRKK